jgi:hypothetical protein
VLMLPSLILLHPAGLLCSLFFHVGRALSHSDYGNFKKPAQVSS